MVALRYNECNWLFQGHKGGKGDLGPKGYRVSFIVKIKGLIVRFFCKKLQPNLVCQNQLNHFLLELILTYCNFLVATYQFGFISSKYKMSILVIQNYSRA